MMRKKLFAIFFLATLALLTVSCVGLHARSGTADQGRAHIKISEGNAVVRIHGQVTQDVHRDFHHTPLDEPLIRRGAVTRNKTRHLSAGEEIALWLVPSEIVTVTVTSLDGGDVEIITRHPSRGERTHRLLGTNRMGLAITL